MISQFLKNVALFWHYETLSLIIALKLNNRACFHISILLIFYIPPCENRVNFSYRYWQKGLKETVAKISNSSNYLIKH